MTLFVADIASYQHGLSIQQLKNQGFSAVIVKCSQGAGYINPYFAGWIAEAKALGFPCASYHYLSSGNWDGQAAEILHADPDPAIPIWLDREGGATLTDALQIANRLRADGQHLAGFYGSRPPVGYGGWWRAAYLSDPTGYASMVYQLQGGDNASLWLPGVDLWQYCQHGRVTGFNGDVDFSAYRGTINQLLATGWFWPHIVSTPVNTPTHQEDDVNAKIVKVTSGPDAGYWLTWLSSARMASPIAGPFEQATDEIGAYGGVAFECSGDQFAAEFTVTRPAAT